MLFYFVRHGQTEANRNHILQGCGLDYPLNEEGHAQARRLAAEIRELIPHPVKRLVVSNLTRARQTAQYLAAELGLEPQVHNDWREWHLGEWEGKSFHDFGKLMLEGGEPTQGETRAAFYRRVRGRVEGRAHRQRALCRRQPRRCVDGAAGRARNWAFQA